MQTFEVIYTNAPHRNRRFKVRGICKYDVLNPCGDLTDKTSARELVRMGLADNGALGGGSPSALSTVYINQAGRDALKA